jgi:hypothetical protein
MESVNALADGIPGQISSGIETEKTRAEGVEETLSNKIDDDISTLDNTLRQKIADDLNDYYTKTETYSKSEVDTKISQIPRYRTVVVNELPAAGEESVIYLVPGTGADSDKYTEYIYVVSEGVGEFIQLGSLSIDLSNYVTKDKIVTMSATQPEYGLWLRPIS